MVSPTRESRRCSGILVSLVLLLQLLRTFVSIVILVAGAIIFGCNPSAFIQFSMCSLPGNTVIAGGLFLIGASLWVGE
jgi:hypothetical protein